MNKADLLNVSSTTPHFVHTIECAGEGQSGPRDAQGAAPFSADLDHGGGDRRHVSPLLHCARRVRPHSWRCSRFVRAQRS